jgi:hypothetical protein
MQHRPASYIDTLSLRLGRDLRDRVEHRLAQARASAPAGVTVSMGQVVRHLIEHALDDLDAPKTTGGEAA